LAERQNFRRITLQKRSLPAGKLLFVLKINIVDLVKQSLIAVVENEFDIH